MDLIYVNKNYLGEDGALYTTELVQWNNTSDELVYNKILQNHQLDLLPGVIDKLKQNEICVSASSQLTDERLRDWLNERNLAQLPCFR